jgi:solute carrier family 9 (sodium/hydrogen exchanger), member 8
MLLILLWTATAELVDLSNCTASCNSNGLCYRLYESVDDSIVDYFICDCYQGFNGEACADCSEGRYGSLCQLCPSYDQKTCAGRGTCDSGVNKSGKCLCEEGFSSETNCVEELKFLENWPSLAAGTSILIIAALLCMLLIILISRFPILPRSVGAIILGISIGLVYSLLYPEANFKQTLFFKPQIFFLILIPPIMFEAGFSLNKTDFFINIGTILIFAVVGTTLTALIFGLMLYTICNLFGLYPFSIIEAFLFGSLISATDPVATISISKVVDLNKSLKAVIFGESVLNDAISIVLFKVFSSFELDTQVVWSHVCADFVYLFFGSIGIGLVIGVLGSVLFKLFKFSEVLDSALFFIWVYIPYLLCEAIGLSGILAILFLGMLMGYYTKESLSNSSKITTEEFFKGFSFISENFCFVYVGIAISLSVENLEIPVILASIGILLSTRAIVVFILAPFCNLFRSHKLSYPEQVMIWLSGARGAIAFSLALSLPLNNAGVFVSTTQYLILFTIVVLGVISYPISKKFDLAESHPEVLHPIFSKLKEYDDKYIKLWLIRSK